MRTIIVILISSFSIQVAAQDNRFNDFNYVNWIQTINTISLNKKWSLHLEYQWRRNEGLKNWQQSLLRVGTNYKLNKYITVHTGYGWIETFPYGDFPLASAGTFPEHRIYEQLVLAQPVNKWTFLHRFRVEQRWVGKVKQGTQREIEDWVFLHRFRYQFRAQRVLWEKKHKQVYGAIADELFIGAGKNLGINIFDQNRVFLLAGYRVNRNMAIEGSYMNQTLQQGKPVNDKIVLQRNNGWVLSTILNF